MNDRRVKVLLALLLVLSGLGLGAGASELPPFVGPLLAGDPASAAASGLSTTAAAPPASQPAGSAFTYQGKLLDNGRPVDGSYDFTFKLFDQATSGTQVGSTNSASGQPVTAGLFTVYLDFGLTAFTGDARWLETATRPAGVGDFTTLSPRQPITPAPYALYALNTRHAKNVVIVSPTGGDFVSIQAALNSITDNSATNRYLVRVGPGTYTEQVTMKQYVDIEGSGEGNTRITFTGSPSGYTGTVVGASNAELSNLTVENTGGDSSAIAVYNEFSSPTLLHLNIVASGATDGTGVNQGIYALFSNSSIIDTQVTASGGAFVNYGVVGGQSSLTLIDVRVLATGAQLYNVGLYVEGGGPHVVRNSRVAASGASIAIDSVLTSVRADRSTIMASTNTIRTDFGTTQVGASKLDGGPVTGSVVQCAGVYDENSTFYASTCP